MWDDCRYYRRCTCTCSHRNFHHHYYYRPHPPLHLHLWGTHGLFFSYNVSLLSTNISRALQAWRGTPSLLSLFPYSWQLITTRVEPTSGNLVLACMYVRKYIHL